MQRCHARLQRELANLHRDESLHDAMPGFAVRPVEAARWEVEVVGPEASPYAGERYALRFDFPESYPIAPPHVRFALRDSEGNARVVPVHEHVYRNGDVCMSSLHDDWVPGLGVRGIVLSITSMLASAERKTRPPNEDHYVRAHRYQRNTRWNFDDEKC